MTRTATLSAAARLGRIAKAFVDLAIPPERLLAVFPLPGPRRGRCLNQGCTAFGRSDYIRHNGSRHGTWESYCLWCGSRFLGERIILSFDLDHGDPRLSRTAVVRAQARLADWRERLTIVLDEADRDGTTLSAAQALEAAGVPRSQICAPIGSVSSPWQTDQRAPCH